MLCLSVLIGAGSVWAYIEGTSPRDLFDRTPAEATALPTVTPVPTPTPTPAPIVVDADSLSARAAIVVAAESGAVRFERDADVALPPASTIKIVTALTVIRHAKPEEVMTILPEDLVDQTVESHMGLEAGDMVTIRDLLIGVLLPSGNDAANALSRFVGERLPGEGTPTERFVAEMNAIAAELGMEGTHFVDAVGLDYPEQVTTARDLARAARALLQEPALATIVEMPRADVPIGGPNRRTLTLLNTNELLTEAGVFGMKTGTTEAAGQCLVLAYHTPAEDQIAVLLGSQDRYSDARALLGLEPPPAAASTE